MLALSKPPFYLVPFQSRQAGTEHTPNMLAHTAWFRIHWAKWD